MENRMNRINEVKAQTKNRFLNLYELETVRRNKKTAPYYVASRAESKDSLKAVTGKNDPDGVVIYAVWGEKKDKLVLIRQFRYPINDYVYEFPAGLVEKGEAAEEAGIRELFEETGLNFRPVSGNPAYSRPFYTSVGMTDESCGMLFGYCDGVPDTKNQEEAEDIEVVLADRKECMRILKEEKTVIMCAYMMMHFIHAKEDPFAFLEEQV